MINVGDVWVNPDCVTCVAWGIVQHGYTTMIDGEVVLLAYVGVELSSGETIKTEYTYVAAGVGSCVKSEVDKQYMAALATLLAGRIDEARMNQANTPASTHALAA